ncbi:MAG: DUF6770 family protein [Bacteroidota bacterium]
MKNLTFVLIAFLLLTSQAALRAQSKAFDGVLKVQLRNVGAITQDDQVTGYYMFYKTDRGKKGMANFELKVIDPELNVVMTKRMTRDYSFSLAQAVSNGEAILFKFWDSKNKKLQFKAYNFQGESVLSRSVGFKDRNEMAMYGREVGSFNTYGTAAIPGYGFLEYLPKKYDKMSYKVKYFPLDEEEKGWTLKGSTKEVESALYLCHIDTILINVVNSRPKLLGAKDTRFILEGISLRSGERLFSTDLMAEGYNVRIINGVLAPDGENILLYGLYHDEGTKVTTKSEGLTKIVLNRKGEVLRDYRLSWEEDFQIDNAEEESEDYGNIFFHQFVAGPAGETYLIGEQYGMNAGLTALSMVTNSRGGSAYKVKDMLIFEMDKDFKLQRAEVVEKSQNSYLAGKLPIGNSTQIGMMMDYYGWFDFTFLQHLSTPGDFTIGYVNFEKKKGAKNELIFGGVTHTGEAYSYDKVSLSTKGKDVSVLRAKPGYVCLVEYTRKTKSLNWRLEKINF